MAKKKSVPTAKSGRTGTSSRLKAKSQKPEAKSAEADGDLRTYTIRDYRLEKPSFTLRQVRTGDQLRYEVESGDLSAPVPPIRESKYLRREQCIEIYRWMLLNRRMETALENLYKQGKVVGGVYFGLGQEACSCASAYALGEDEWLGPMIRNQGALLVQRSLVADHRPQPFVFTKRVRRRARASFLPQPEVHAANDLALFIEIFERRFHAAVEQHPA